MISNVNWWSNNSIPVSINANAFSQGSTLICNGVSPYAIRLLLLGHFFYKISLSFASRASSPFYLARVCDACEVKSFVGTDGCLG